MSTIPTVPATVPATSTTRCHGLIAHPIHVVIPAPAHNSTLNKGHPAIAGPQSNILSTPPPVRTAGLGNGACACASPATYGDSPVTPTAPSRSARAMALRSRFSTSTPTSAAGDADAHLDTMAEQDKDTLPQGAQGGDEEEHRHSASVESSRTGSPVEPEDGAVALLRAA